MDTLRPVNISTNDPASYADIIGKLFVPDRTSHKGQNGKVLIIGGSQLFHSAVIWPAEVASHFADMVHVTSTDENNEIIRAIKEKWQGGIVIPQESLPGYVVEDDCALLGNGMMRVDEGVVLDEVGMSLKQILTLKDEGRKTYHLSRFLLHTFPEKKWVLDAGALQMMKAEWLLQLKVPPIITPHQKEFEQLFGVAVSGFGEEEKIETVSKTAKQYGCIILLKSGYDIISDGVKSYVVKGGNAGLTKGGTGDILAGITLAFYAKNPAVDSAVAASLLLKKAAESLEREKGIWFDNRELIARLPRVMHEVMSRHNSAYGGLVDTAAAME